MFFRYCPVCGAELEERTIDHQAVPACQNSGCGFVFWQNSKPAVSALITNDKGEILLAERGREPQKGKFDLPGGFLMDGERPEDGMRREAKEELGVELNIGEYFDCAVDRYGDSEFWVLILGYEARISSGEITPGDDVSGAEWVDPENFDRKTLAFRNNAELIDLWRKKRGK